MLYFSYQQNVKFVNFVIALDTEMKSPLIEDHVYKELLFSLGAALLRTVIVQCVIGFIYQYLNPMVLKYRWLSKTILISFLFPVILSLLPLPTWILVHVPFYTMMLPVAVSKYIFWSSVPAMTQYIISGWRFCRNFVV